MKQNQNVLWDELINKTDRVYNNPEHFWKQIKQLMGMDTSNIPYLLDPDGNKLTTAERQAQEFRRHLGKTFSISDEENLDFCLDTQREVENFLNETDQHKYYDNIDLSRLDRNNYLTTPISRNAVIGKLRSFKNKKAPGHSKIN